MANPFKRARWSPYVVGVGIGVLSWLTFSVMGKALGTSTSMVQAAGAIEAVVAPAHVRENALFMKQFEKTPLIDWQMALVLLLPVGALVGAKLANQKRSEHMPEVWRARFGDNRMLRYAAAFLGGAVLLFGARLAGGCTSGHGISGGLQLAVSSWIFFGAMFVSGVVTAMALYTLGGRRPAGGGA